MYYYGENALKELDELNVNSLGIINKVGGFTGAHTSRILVIGLGGMGLKTVLRLKKELNERIGKIDDSYLRILSFDTDGVARQTALDTELLAAHEIPRLDNTAVGRALEADEQFRPKSVGSIIPDSFGQVLTGKGANQIRLAGRLTVMELNLFRTIYDSIRDAISQLRDFAQTTLDVRIVAGIGGGSGSGLVIDIPYIVRSVVEKLGIDRNRVRIFGHIYLPNSYGDGIPNKDAAYENGYAALKEIDYYMSLNEGETFDALYPDPVGQISSTEKIFKQCTLIGGKIAGDIVMVDPEEKALSVCVEDLVNQCTSVKGNVNGKDGSIVDFFSDQSFQDNTNRALAVVKANSDTNFPDYGNYNYNIIGATSIKFPTEAIIEQLVGEVNGRAEALLQKNIDRLTQKDVDDFESGLINPAELFEVYSKKLGDKIDEYLNDNNVQWNRNSILGNDHTVILDDIQTKAIEDFDKDDSTVDRVIAEANRKAALIFSDPNKGPYYLAKLLMSKSSSGGSVQGFYEKISKYDTLVVSRRTAFERSLADFEKQKNELAQTMQGMMKFNRNLDSFKNILKDIYMTKFKIMLCDRLNDEFYVDINQARGVSYRLKNNLDREFLAYVDIFSKLSELMASNLSIAKDKLNDHAENDPTSIFDLHDAEFDALKSTVRSTVSSKLMKLGEEAPSKYAAALTSDIMGNKKDWALTEKCLYGDSKCADSFRKFISNYQPFGDVVNMKMLDYFNAAYEGQTDSFKSTVIEKLINVIKYHSAPMCNVWQSPYFDFAGMMPLRYQYLVLPDGFNSNDTTWGEMFDSKFKTNNTDNVYWSPDQNAIYSYTLYAKMPIWIHRDLIDYEKQYNRLSSKGVHINEHPSMKPAYRDYPALMIPSQWYRAKNGSMEYTNDVEAKIFEDVKNVFRYAKDHGIIVQDDASAYVVSFINDKPNPNDDRSNVRISSLVSKFEDELENSGSDKFTYKKVLFAKMKAAFGSEDVILSGAGGFVAKTEDDAINLLRKQMKLLGRLRDEIEYYKTNFETPIKNWTHDIAIRKHLVDFTKYMLFDLVFSEKGNWKYRLGDQTFNIVARFDVDETKSDYMEMAASEALLSLESYSEHKALLDKRLSTIQRNIADEIDDGAYEALNTKYTALKKRCEGVIEEVDNREASGNILKSAEISRRDFYRAMLKAAVNVMKAFAD